VNLPFGDVANGATYLDAGWFSISVPNLIILLVMFALFVLALVLPFPKGSDAESGDES
jgi:hypothetical protein